MFNALLTLITDTQVGGRGGRQCGGMLVEKRNTKP